VSSSVDINKLDSDGNRMYDDQGNYIQKGKRGNPRDPRDTTFLLAQDIIGLGWDPTKNELGLWRKKDEHADKPTYLWRSIIAVLSLETIELKSFNCDSEQLSLIFSKPVFIERVGDNARVIPK